MKDWILVLVSFFQAHPYSLVFFGLLACGLGLPLPEEFFLVMSGYVCYLNRVPDVVSLWPMFVVTWVAIAGGDALAFMIGRRFGNSVFETRLMKKLVSTEGKAKAERFLREYGKKTIFAARFLPGLRMPTYLLCGSLGVPYLTFAFWDGLAMLISVPIQVYLAWRFGAVLDVALAYIKTLNQTFLALAILIVLAIYIKIHLGPRAATNGVPQQAPAVTDRPPDPAKSREE
ncbi:MAG: DedA family protein [Candidatus Riflebacteria bacterium]|nr:DedA family protein [Candidatus Riflebacteria bacterium]